MNQPTQYNARQLTNLPNGVQLEYFRLPKQLPGGWVLARGGKHERGYQFVLVHPESQECRLLPIRYSRLMQVRPEDGRAWWVDPEGIAVWSAVLPDGRPERIATTAAFGKLAVHGASVSCDGRWLYFIEVNVVDPEKYPLPTVRDPQVVWNFLNRPRTGVLWAMDLANGNLRALLRTDGYCPIHIEASPTTPSLVRYCHDLFEGYHQRIWTITLEEGVPKPCRPQQRGEMVTHEFWWTARPNWIGYTYQDRRQDTTIEQIPWLEYSPIPTQFGIADETGREVYLSEGLNSYHTHLICSPDGRWLAGEGTDGNSFVYLAPLSLTNRRIDFKPVAAIDTPYVPFRGQNVEACFSGDSKWLLFNRRVNGVFQVWAAEVRES